MVLRSLDRLDARHGRWLRRRPEVGLVVIAALFVAGTAVHAIRYEPSGAEPRSDGRAAEVVPEDTGDALLVGPAPDDDLDGYAGQRLDELDALARDQPAGVAPAIVSLADYRSPAEVDALLAEADVAVYAARYRLRPASELLPAAASVDSLPRGRIGVQDTLVVAVTPALEREAAQAREQAAALARMAETTDDEEFAATFSADRQLLLAAAEAAGPDCPCVYAVEVVGPLEALAALSAADVVRLVDPAPVGTDPDVVVFLAILPGQH